MDKITFDTATSLDFKISILENRIREIKLLFDLFFSEGSRVENPSRFRLEGHIQPESRRFLLFEEEDLFCPESEAIKEKFSEFLMNLHIELTQRLEYLRKEFRAL